MLEVLTPAPGTEALIAAVPERGRTRFAYALAAQGRADSRSRNSRRAVRYCRVRGCRVYAELDTLVADSEMSAAADFVRSASEAGVDAVIAQDWGFLAAAKAVAPLLRAFAGERLGIHNAAGLEAGGPAGRGAGHAPEGADAGGHRGPGAAQQRGAGRHGPGGVVLLLGGPVLYGLHKRPRKRQPRGLPGLCREKYSLGGRMDDYPLSLKDTSGLDYIPELEAMGIACAARRPGA